MNMLPFARLREIDHLLANVPLRNLVLVIPGAETGQFSIIYNESHPPISSNHGLTVQTLEDAWRKPISYVKGPIVGFAALQMVFPHLPFHGSHFFPIGHIEAFQRASDLYYENAYYLARWLWYRYESSSEAHVSNIIKLGLMKYIASQLGDLFAVIIHTPSSDFPFNYSQNWLTIADIEHAVHFVPSRNTWVIGFREVTIANSNLKIQQFIELRTILHSMSADIKSSWKRNLRALASFFDEQATRRNDDHFKKTAYALAGEAQLLDQDTEDVVAILPHRDFRRFLEIGESICITRIPHVSRSRPTSQSRCYALNDISFIPHTADYNNIVITFPSLAVPVFHQHDNVIDLSVILYQTGQIASLARTLCLLANDLLTHRNTEIAEISIREITAMAIRAVMLFSLSDPWDKQWRGRYSVLLRQAYRCLDECWIVQEAQASEPLKSFYKAQRAWYGCLNTDDIVYSLSTIRSSCRDFLDTSGHKFTQERQQIEQLLTITEALLPHVPTAVETAFYFENDIRIWSWQSDPPLISSFFYHLLRKYFEIDQEWQKWQEAMRMGKAEAEYLQVLLDRLMMLCQQAHALGHEVRLLCWACEHKKNQIKRWQNGFQRGPMLRLHVLNSTVVMNKPDHLYIEIENIGGSKAHDVRIMIVPSEHFKLIPPDALLKYIALISPQQLKRLSWKIEAYDVLLEIHFQLRYRDAEGREIVLDEMISIDTISPQKLNMPPRGGNPFQAGTPVFGERFFGREREIREILNLLLGGVSQPILLRGPRRSGKSSIIWHIRHLLSTYGMISQLGFTEEEELALHQVRPVTTSLQAIPDISFINSWFQNVFRNICLSIGAMNFYTEQVVKDFRDALPTGVFRFHLDRLLRAYPSMRLLVMIDEWDEQRHLGVLGRTLRYLMQEEQRVNWIVASTWILREELGRYGSPFYSQTRPIELKEMTWEAAEALVRRLSDKAGIHWQSDALVALLDRTGRRPYLIQWLCQEIVSELMVNRTSLVDRMLLNSVLSKVIRAPQMKGQPFAFLWEQVYLSREDASQPHLYWLARLILWVLIQSHSSHLPYEMIQRRVKRILQDNGLNISDKIFEKEFAEQMAQLEYVFDVIMQNDDGYYSFSVPLQQEWFQYIISQYDDAVSEICRGVAADFGLLE